VLSWLERALDKVRSEVSLPRPTISGIRIRCQVSAFGLSLIPDYDP